MIHPQFLLQDARGANRGDRHRVLLLFTEFHLTRDAAPNKVRAYNLRS
jgi:hypothetical protein